MVDRPVTNACATDATEQPFLVIAIDVGGTKIAGGIVVYETRASSPTVHARRAVPTEAKSGGDVVLDRVVAVVRELIEEASARFIGPIAGIGVSAAGTVDEKTGVIAFANDIMPGWMGQQVGPQLEAQFGLPCAVLNDVHAYAWGELRHGAARGAETAVVAAAGTGLGGAVVVNGSVLGGSRGYAGMLGHTLHHAAEGHLCACGVEGHLECVASGSGIEARYAELAGRSLTGPEISRLAGAGDVVARQVIECAGRSLGESVASWASILDPEVAVVSGSVAKAGPIWREALENGFRSRAMAEFKDLPIVDAVLGDDAPLVGAAERLLDRIAR